MGSGPLSVFTLARAPCSSPMRRSRSFYASLRSDTSRRTQTRAWVSPILSCMTDVEMLTVRIPPPSRGGRVPRCAALPPGRGTRGGWRAPGRGRRTPQVSRPRPSHEIGDDDDVEQRQEARTGPVAQEVSPRPPAGNYQGLALLQIVGGEQRIVVNGARIEGNSHHAHPAPPETHRIVHRRIHPRGCEHPEGDAEVHGKHREALAAPGS